MWFKRLLIAIGVVSTATVFLLITMLLFMQDGTALFEFMTFILGSLVCSIPVLLLGVVATGIDTLIKSSQKKKRNEEFLYEAVFDDARIESIMSKLSPQERDYLERRLTEREIGLGDDGEIISIDNLLDEFEEKSRRNR